MNQNKVWINTNQNYSGGEDILGAYATKELADRYAKIQGEENDGYTISTYESEICDRFLKNHEQ